MSLLIREESHSSVELEALRRLIVQLAAQCNLDLRNRAAIRHFLDGSQETRLSESVDPQLCHELRAMLVLLYRLEGSSSEDLGFDGMRRLWRQHSETLARFDSVAPE